MFNYDRTIEEAARTVAYWLTSNFGCYDGLEDVLRYEINRANEEFTADAAARFLQELLNQLNGFARGLWRDIAEDRHLNFPEDNKKPTKKYMKKWERRYWENLPYSIELILRDVGSMVGAYFDLDRFPSEDGEAFQVRKEQLTVFA